MQWCKLSQHITVANQHTSPYSPGSNMLHVCDIIECQSNHRCFLPTMADFLCTNRLVLQLKVTTEINTGTLNWECSKDRWYIWLQVPYICSPYWARNLHGIRIWALNTVKLLLHVLTVRDRNTLHYSPRKCCHQCCQALLKDCAETHLNSGVMSTFVFLRVTIAHSDRRWYHETSWVMCITLGWA